MTQQLLRRKTIRALFERAVATTICICVLSVPKTVNALERRARVADVIDGDTIVVILEGKREHVRLIGIDTPESRPNRRTELQSQNSQQDQKTILQQGKRAAVFTRQLIRRDEHVTLEFDVRQRDHYRRMLAYVWLPNKTMANEEILKAGFAYLLTVPPNVKYRQRLASAFKEARERKRGLWHDGKPAPKPTAPPKQSEYRAFSTSGVAGQTPR